MIVVTLLKLHMGTSGAVLVLFISFFLTGWIGMASTTRMQFYRYKNQEYVLAARTLGASDARIIVKHIFPNAVGTLVTSCALVIPSMIYSEVNLSYSFKRSERIVNRAARCSYAVTVPCIIIVEFQLVR